MTFVECALKEKPPLGSWDRLQTEAMFKKLVSELLGIEMQVEYDHKKPTEEGKTAFVNRANANLKDHWKSSRGEDFLLQLKSHLQQRGESLAFGSNDVPKFERWSTLLNDVFKEFKPFILTIMKLREMEQDGFKLEHIAHGFARGLMVIIVEMCDQWWANRCDLNYLSWKKMAEVYFGEQIHRQIDRDWRNVVKKRRYVDRNQSRGSGGESIVPENLDRDADDPVRIAYFEERKRILHRAIEQLQEDERNVIKLRYFEHLTIAEVAERLGFDRNKVYRLEKSAKEQIPIFVIRLSRSHPLTQQGPNYDYQ